MAVWINGFEDRLTEGGAGNLQASSYSDTSLFDTADGFELGSSIRNSEANGPETAHRLYLTAFGPDNFDSAANTDTLAINIRFKVDLSDQSPSSPPFAAITSGSNVVTDFITIDSSISNEPAHLRVQFLPSDDIEGNSSKFSTFYVVIARAASNSLGYEQFVVVPASIMFVGQWYTMRMRVVLDSTTGAIDMNIHRGNDPNPMSTYSVSNFNTLGSNAGLECESVTNRLEPGMFIDDFILATDSDASALLPICTVVSSHPSGAGFTSEWTNTVAGEANWQVLDETDTFDGKLMSSSTTASVELVIAENLPSEIPADATIPFVSCEVVGASDLGTGEIRFLYRDSSTVDFVSYNNTLFSLPATLSSNPHSTQASSAVIPGTVDPWTRAALSGVQFGVELKV